MKKPGGKGRTKTSKQEYGGKVKMEMEIKKWEKWTQTQVAVSKRLAGLCVSNEWNEFVW